MTDIRNPRSVIGGALLLGAALMFAVAVAIFTESLPVGAGLGKSVAIVLAGIAAADLLLGLFFLTRP